MPIYVLLGEAGNEILLGVSEQETLGITSSKDILDAMSQQGAKEMVSRNLRDQEGGNQLFKIMKVKLCKLSEMDYETNERIDNEDEIKEVDDIDEQGVRNEEKAEGSTTIDEAIQAMLERARDNGAFRYLMKRLREQQVNKFKVFSGMS